MPELLKITTPVLNKADPQVTKQLQDPNAAFNLPDVQKVAKPATQGEILKQNNGMLQGDEAPAILMNLLKDPSVTVGFLKNIFMLQEIIQLLPVNNTALTQDIQQLFDALLIQPEEIAAEMTRQENTSTAFKGELFNFLRSLSSETVQIPEMKQAVANLLKAVNHHQGNQDVLDGIANTLQFLGQSVGPSRELSSRLLQLSAQFRQESAPPRFEQLKSEVLTILQEVEDSILFTPKLQKMVSITVYNLSRYNDNPDFLQESIAHLMTLLDSRQRQDFQRALTSFFVSESHGREEESSNIMDVLTNIIGRETSDETLTLLNAEKIERIIHSLLSSPCNFTPLLHYVIPVQSDWMKAFAEIWINPNGHEDERERQGGSGSKGDIHMLIVFDIEGIGQFEAELYAREQSIDLSLLCPPAYLKTFEEKMMERLSPSIAGLPYHFGNIRIDKLEHTRSLMDVFKSLPYKRTGINVKI